MRTLLACILAALFWTSQGAHAGLTKIRPPSYAFPRLALVVGLTSYQSVSPIRNGVKDARLVAASLEKIGFEVDLVINPTRAEFENAIARHKRRVGVGAISAFYYSGQGATIDATSYMVAIDADLNKGRLEQVGLSFEGIATEFHVESKEGLSVAFFDASRSNPYDAPAGSPSRGIAVERKAAHPTAPGPLLYYATVAGGQAMDGDGDNGPYAVALAGALAKANADQYDLFREIRNGVVDATNGSQVPDFVDQPAIRFVLNRSELAEDPEDTAESRAAKALYESAPGEFTPTYEDGSYALLIGVSDYDMTDGRQAWRDLPAVKDEMLRLAKVLKEVHGFEVETVMDPTSEQLEAAMESFVNRNGAKPNARLVIAMSGHGATTTSFDKKVAWFVPRDAPAMKPPAPFRNTALNLRRVEEWSEVMESKHVLWIFDSCFSGAAIKMIDRKSGAQEDGWSVHLHTHPVRRVITAGSENEEVPAKSRFMERLIDVMSGAKPLGDGTLITGREIGEFLREDLIRYTYKEGLPPETPQTDTIVIPNEEGDIVFRIEPQLTAGWRGKDGVAAE